MMLQREKYQVKVLMFCSIVITILIMFSLNNVNAQTNGVTVGYWPLDENKSSDYNVITPDTASSNSGIVVGHPEPSLVEGKFDKAMQFDGANGVYIPIKFVIGFPPTPKTVYMPISTNLDVQKQVSVQAWINVPALKDVDYNNIVVKCDHPDQACAWQNTTRVLGIALRAGEPKVGERFVEGVLSGFVYTDQDGYNEIVTAQPVTLNQWIHVEFTRTTSGMHLYINGHEQEVDVLHGVQNPKGNIINGTEIYFGHDSLATIDDVRIMDLEPTISEAAFDIGPNILIAAVVISVVFAVAWFLRRAVQIWMVRSKS